MFLSAHMGGLNSAAAAGLCSWCFEATGIEYTQDGERFQLANDPPFGFPPVVGVQGGDMTRGVNGRPHYGFVGMWGVDALAQPQVQDIGVRHSTDGGVTWTRAPIAQRTDVRYLSMPSPSTWFVTAGTWPRAESASAHVVGQRLALALDNRTQTVGWHSPPVEAARRSVDGRSGYSTAVLKTEDSGRSWSTVFEDRNTDFYLNNLDCTDDSTCLAVGEGERVVLLRTSDGGRSWAEISLPVEGDASVMDVKCVSARECYLAGGFLSQTRFEGFVLVSRDGGLTWARDGPTINGLYPVSLSLYLRRDGSTGGHGVGITPQGLSSTMKYV